MLSIFAAHSAFAVRRTAHSKIAYSISNDSMANLRMKKLNRAALELPMPGETVTLEGEHLPESPPAISNPRCVDWACAGHDSDAFQVPRGHAGGRQDSVVGARSYLVSRG